MGKKGKNKQERLTDFRQELNLDDHRIELYLVVQRYNTDLKKGLTSANVQEKLRIYGLNRLNPPKTKSRFLLLMEYIFGGFAILLWMGAILSFVGFAVSYFKDTETPLDNIYLGTVLIIVILVTGFFGFYQESTNQSIMESFSKMIPKSATVIRDGNKQLISCEYIVVGDIVKLQAGDCIPADIRIVESMGLKVDNSSITGESDPQVRSTECTDTEPMETANLAFYGTNVVEGQGTGLVVATGDNTLMGHIAGLTAGLEPEDTPIKKELSKFIHLITAVAVTVGVIIFILAMLLGYNFFDAFLYFIAIIVASVPEGLLVTMTACLSLTAKRMKRKNCLVKKLQAIETLGSTTTICSDKTGTLTQNRMTVSHLYYDNIIIDVLSRSYVKGSGDGFTSLCRVAALCSRAEFRADQENVEIDNKIVIGDASESGVLKFIEKIQGDVMQFRKEFEKIFEVPFNSVNKYQFSIHQQSNSNKLLLVMKGAPERIIDRCSTISLNGEKIKLEKSMQDKLKQAMLELGYMGERVLGFAELEMPSTYTTSFPFETDQSYPTTDLNFCGFISMIDPPRESVPDAVRKCKSAGIQVVMVTGDHPITALAIARKVGIISAENETLYDIAMRQNISASNLLKQDSAHCVAIVVPGWSLREMNAEDLEDILTTYKEIVFARTSPQQKLQIVEAFQRIGNVVAVTGDGVNDSPALKKADIGIAMGIAGSDVSKEAADMILLDDNFASIVVGVEEGRIIFDNLKKSIAYILTSNVPETVPFLLLVIFNMPPSLSVMAILLIDVGTDLWPGISIAYETAESDIMKRPPRNPKHEHLVGFRMLCYCNLNVGVTQAFGGLACFFYTMSEHGFLPRRLLGLRKEWISDINDLEDSYGQEWTKEERIILERKGTAAFFMAIVILQVADVIISKTRRLSIFQHGMRNQVMNTGILFECALAALIVYCPKLNNILQFEPIHPYLLLPIVPFFILIIGLDELRKYIIRKYPDGLFTMRQSVGAL